MGQSSLKKGLTYSLIAVTLGVLTIVIPLFIAPTTDMGFGAELAPQTLSERMKSIEEHYGPGEAPMQSYLVGLLTLVVGFTAAVAAYSIVKAIIFH
ncbi:MAG: hypothetical protein QW161_05790 [Candidatus Bathyarchaeia archaeon]